MDKDELKIESHFGVTSQYRLLANDACFVALSSASSILMGLVVACGYCLQAGLITWSIGHVRCSHYRIQ